MRTVIAGRRPLAGARSLVMSYPAAMDAQALPDSRRLEQIGEYAVHRVIGEGGMGIVYEATERLSGRKVALKVLSRALTDSPEARARFFAEMRIMAGLEHPNIVRSLSNLEVDGKLVIVLEFLAGRTLRAELGAHGRVPPARAISIARDGLERYRLDLAIVRFDLEATRREREALRARLEAAGS